MASKRDYYEILGIDKNADANTIKNAYRKLAVKYHPDKNKGDKEAENKFKEATEAYEVLKDPQKRQQYDQFGHAAFSAGAGAGGSGFSGFGGFDGFDISDALRAFMNDFGGDSFFSDFFGGSMGSRGSRSRGGGAAANLRGRDLQVHVALTLEEINTGAKKSIKYKRFRQCSKCSGKGGSGVRTCPVCRGSGQVRKVTQSLFGQMVNVTSCSNCRGSGQVVSDTCPNCRGEGRIRDQHSVSVNIPAGVHEGNYIPIRGQGDVGVRGGDPGDLIVVVEEKKHDIFERHGTDLVCELSISMPQAVLGDQVIIETLDGKLKINIKPGTRSESILRLRGKGLPELNNTKIRGDILVKIHIETPQHLSKEEKELYTGLKEIEKTNGKSKNIFRKAKRFFS